MTCSQCKQEFNVLYMCDESDTQLCGSCFEQTDCSQNLHEEGCATMVVENETLEDEEECGPFTCPDCGGDCETLLAALKTSLAGGAQ